MTLVKNDEGTAIQLTEVEWEALLTGEPQVKITGYSKGYFMLRVSMEEMEDPYK